MPLPGNLPRILGIVGPYERARELTNALAQFEPIGLIDMDAPVHEALTDLHYLSGQGEDVDWSRLTVEPSVLSLRNWALKRYDENFFAYRVVEEIRAAEDSHGLYVVPNIRTLAEHRVLRTAHHSYEYMCVHIRDGSWEPRVSDSWALDPANHVLQFEVGETSLLEQLLHVLEEDAA